MVKLSEYVCVVKVDNKVEVADNGILTLRNELRQIENPKGAWPQEKPLVIFTVKNIEDAPGVFSPGLQGCSLSASERNRSPTGQPTTTRKDTCPCEWHPGGWLYYTEEITASYAKRILEEHREIIRRDAAPILQGEALW
jgi:hypothetical protein